jgi:hypothetical protein
MFVGAVCCAVRNGASRRVAGAGCQTSVRGQEAEQREVEDGSHRVGGGGEIPSIEGHGEQFLVHGEKK